MQRYPHRQTRLRRGATIISYALLLGLASLGAVIAVDGVGTQTAGLLRGLADGLDTGGGQAQAISVQCPAGQVLTGLRDSQPLCTPIQDLLPPDLADGDDIGLTGPLAFPSLTDVPGFLLEGGNPVTSLPWSVLDLATIPDGLDDGDDIGLTGSVSYTSLTDLPGFLTESNGQPRTTLPFSALSDIPSGLSDGDDVGGLESGSVFFCFVNGQAVNNSGCNRISSSSFSCRSGYAIQNCAGTSGSDCCVRQ